jgi:hypothetical protein
MTEIVDLANDVVAKESQGNFEAEVNDLIHMFFDAELKGGGKPIKREDIISQILPGQHRLFNKLFEAAQKRLQDEFGMQIKQLPTLAPLEVSGMSATQKRLISRKAGTAASNSYLYTLVRSENPPIQKDSMELDLTDQEIEQIKAIEKNELEQGKRSIGLLTLTLCIIQIREGALPMDELIAIFKRQFGHVPEYESLVRDTWKKKKYLRFTSVPKEAEDLYDEYESAASSPLVSWGSRAHQEFPIDSLFDFLTKYFPARQETIGKVFRKRQ